MAEQRKRDTSIRFRVTEEEERLIKGAAERAGLSVSAWIRFHLLRLAREGNNGN